MAIDTHGVDGKPWVGFDLDGTLATYDKWLGVAHIGDPVKPMCDLIKKLHSDGKGVKIVTARVAPREDGSHLLARAFIAKWCKDNLGFVPPITHEKDSLMETLYDDRVKAVEQNTGKVLNMAKFKVGDRVKDKRGNIGIVVGIQDDDAGPFGPPPSKYGAILRIKTDDGKTGYLEEANASLANSRACNSKFKVGDKVRSNPQTVKPEWQGTGTVIKVITRGSGGALYHFRTDKGRELTDIESNLVAANSRSACNSTNPIVRKAMNAATGKNFEKGDFVELTSGDTQQRKWRIDEVYGDGNYRVVSTTGRIESISVPASVLKATNTRTLPVSQLGWTKCEKRGIEVMKKYLEKSGGALPKMSDEISRILGVVPDIDTTEKQNVMSYFKYGDGKKFVRNAEDAQGHEHGSDGKFTSKGGGSKKDSEDFHSHIDSLAAKAASGEDGYEDPKTKRMRERLAKMREKTEALRKDNERRRAALVGKRAELDKMRADIMKANVDRWKAGVSASKNAVVAKAMNAVARNANEYVLTIKYRGKTTPVVMKKFSQPYGRSRAMKYLFDGGWMSDNHAFDKDTDSEMVFIAANPTE